EVLKLAEVTDAEIDSGSQRAQPGSCEIDHGIRSIDTDHSCLRKPLQKLVSKKAGARAQIQRSYGGCVIEGKSLKRNTHHLVTVGMHYIHIRVVGGNPGG